MMKRDGIDHDGLSEKVKKTLRGRAEKACVRCRAKKRICDGGNPCLRCKESHSACYFSDWHYTVPYPREYVEYLEEQQEQLSAGLMTMYRILKESNMQTTPILPDKPQIQELLAALKGLKLSNQSPPLIRSGLTTGEGLKDGQHPRVEKVSMPAQGEYNNSVPSPMNHHSTTLPLHPASMFMPRFGSGTSLHSPNMTADASNPTPVTHNYPAVPYRSFEFTQSIHPPMPVTHPHGLQAASTARHDFLACRDGVMQVPEPWHLSPASLVPSTRASLDDCSERPTPFASTPNMFAEQRHQSMPMHQQAQPNVSQPWAWVTAADLPFYASPLGSHHHSGPGQDIEPIEQRGDIGTPHDSQGSLSAWDTPALGPQ